MQRCCCYEEKRNAGATDEQWMCRELSMSCVRSFVFRQDSRLSHTNYVCRDRGTSEWVSRVVYVTFRVKIMLWYRFYGPDWILPTYSRFQHGGCLSPDTYFVSALAASLPASCAYKTGDIFKKMAFAYVWKMMSSFPHLFWTEKKDAIWKTRKPAQRIQNWKFVAIVLPLYDIDSEWLWPCLGLARTVGYYVGLVPENSLQSVQFLFDFVCFKQGPSHRHADLSLLVVWCVHLTLLFFLRATKTSWNFRTPTFFLTDNNKNRRGLTVITIIIITIV